MGPWGFFISTCCWLLKVSLLLEEDTASPLKALMGATGVIALAFSRRQRRVAIDHMG